MTLSRVIATTTPSRRLRALDFLGPPRSRSSRETSAADTVRWPPRRSKWILPARSQRRSVSTLTPSADAAAPMRSALSMPSPPSVIAPSLSRAHHMGAAHDAVRDLPDREPVGHCALTRPRADADAHAPALD